MNEVIDAPTSAIAAYSPFYAQLAELKSNNEKLVFNYADKKGNKEARSHVYKLRQTKAALEKVRVDEKSESVRIGKAIDAEAKVIAAEIEAMITIHQAEIDRIEQIETARIDNHKAAIKCIVDCGNGLIGGQPQAFALLFYELEEVIIVDESFEEFEAEAHRAKTEALAKLKKQFADHQKLQSEKEELERLRAESEARVQADRDAAMVAAAVELARVASEQLAVEQAKKAAQAIADAEAEAKTERETAERRELELKLAAENAERRRVEAEQKAAQDAKDALAKAESDKAKAVVAEQERVAAIEKAEADALAKREANKAHLAKINRTAVAAMVAGGINEETAKQVIVMIVKGGIPAVSIQY